MTGTTSSKDITVTMPRCKKCNTPIFWVKIENSTHGTICIMCDVIRGSIIKYGDYEEI